MQYKPQRSLLADTRQAADFIDGILDKLGGEIHRGWILNNGSLNALVQNCLAHGFQFGFAS